MRRRWLSTATVMLASLVSGTLWAHPGHGVEDEGWLHWLSSPLHLTEIGLSVLLVVFVAYLVRRLLGRPAAWR